MSVLAVYCSETFRCVLTQCQHKYLFFRKFVVDSLHHIKDILNQIEFQYCR